MHQFTAADQQGGISSNLDPGSRKFMMKHGTYQFTSSVMCYPLGELLGIIGVQHVDFFALDVQGAELGILRTIDWKRIRIDTLAIEYDVFGFPDESNKKLADIRAFMNSTGRSYREIAIMGIDVLFQLVHEQKP